MANKRTKSIREEAYGYKKKTGKCIDTSTLRKESGKKPWRGATSGKKNSYSSEETEA